MKLDLVKRTVIMNNRPRTIYGGFVILRTKNTMKDFHGRIDFENEIKKEKDKEDKGPALYYDNFMARVILKFFQEEFSQEEYKEFSKDTIKYLFFQREDLVNYAEKYSHLFGLEEPTRFNMLLEKYSDLSLEELEKIAYE